MALSLSSLTYMSHPAKEKPRGKFSPSRGEKKSKKERKIMKSEQLSDVGGFHLSARLRCGVNLLYWGTSLLLRNKARHDEEENSMGEFAFRALFGLVEGITFRHRFSLVCSFCLRDMDDEKIPRIVFDQSFKILPAPSGSVWWLRLERSATSALAGYPTA